MSNQRIVVMAIVAGMLLCSVVSGFIFYWAGYYESENGEKYLELQAKHIVLLDEHIEIQVMYITLAQEVLTERGVDWEANIMLQDLIKTANDHETEADRLQKEAASKVEEYILAQTVTIQELYDIVKSEYNDRVPSSNQISTWHILNIAQKAILAREYKNAITPKLIKN